MMASALFPDRNVSTLPFNTNTNGSSPKDQGRTKIETRMVANGCESFQYSGFRIQGSVPGQSDIERIKAMNQGRIGAR